MKAVMKDTGVDERVLIGRAGVITYSPYRSNTGELHCLPL